MPGVHVKVGGTWREVTNVAVKSGGTWRESCVVHVKSGGTWRDCGPVYLQTDSWLATWGQSYQGSNAKRDDVAGNERLYHGYSSIWGGQLKGAFGFDYADIQATLSGRSIYHVSFQINNDHFYNPTGVIRFGGHNHASEPTTFVSTFAYDDATYGHETGTIARDSSYGVGDTTPLGPVGKWGELLRDGTIKGLYTGMVSGSTSTTYYGYCYSVDGGEGLEPSILIKHTP